MMKPLPVRERERTLGSFDTPEAAVTSGAVEKLLVELDDGNSVEAIIISTFGPRVARLLRWESKLTDRTGHRPTDRSRYIQKKIRYETCVSTQVGCALDCQFCASSLVPFVRNMTAEEMLREIHTVEANIPAGGRLAKVVFAGVGEPLMNYENVSAVVRKLAARGVRSRVNTVGVIPYLERLFAERLPVELIISIHAPDDERRTALMPVGKGYPLADVCRVLKSAPPEMLIEAKYLMLAGLNDSAADARMLAALVRDLPVIVTLQMYNTIAERDFKPSDKATIRTFASVLRDEGIRVAMLNSNIGEPVQGGCGQLRARIETKKNPRLPVIEA